MVDEINLMCVVQVSVLREAARRADSDAARASEGRERADADATRARKEADDANEALARA